MFKVGQKVWSTLYGWGTVLNISGNTRVHHEKVGEIVYALDGSRYTSGPGCLYPGKPIISGYEPPPFEGKLKKGDDYLVRWKSGPPHGRMVTVLEENAEAVHCRSHATGVLVMYLKSEHSFHPIGGSVY